MKDIAFCAIIKNEARYLDEWLAYHYLIGVEHFYITDDNSTDNIKSVLQKWIKAGLVTYMKVDEFLKTSPVRQILSDLTYCDVLKNSWKYLGFLDIDEFFVPPNGNIKDFLNSIPGDIESIASIYVRWAFFDLSEESSGLLTERCLNHTDYFTGHGKSIVNPRNIAINTKTNPHIFHPVQGKKIIDFDFSPAQWSEDLSFFKDIPITQENANLPHINHYYGKSRAEIAAKQLRGRFNANKNVYSVHNFYEKKGFPANFFNLAGYSNVINDVVKELKDVFPDDFVEEGLSYLHGDELLAGAKTLNVSNLKSPQYIVSLTSYGKRLQTTAPIAIASILHGSLLPDRIILWVSDEEKEIAEQNAQLKILRSKGLEIRYCEDLRSYTKLIYALQEFPNDYIITIDDDLLYPNNWFGQIMENHKAYPSKIICHRVHGIRVDSEHNLLPYENWDWCAEPEESERVFPTGCGGILYPPNCLHKDVLNRELFMKLAPKADDIWFWAMALINSAENPYIVVPNGYSNNIIDLGIQSDALQKSNVINYENDRQLNVVIDEYPQIKKVIKRIKPFSSVYIEKVSNANFNLESPQMKYPEQKGLISVIVPVYNNEIYLRECLDSLLSQKFKNWEAVIVNDGSTDNTGKIIDEYAEKDSRFIVIQKENGGTLQARKTGLENSKGEYIASLDSDDTYPEQFLEKMFEKITETNSDFVWCKINSTDNCEFDKNDYKWSENKAENVRSVFTWGEKKEENAIGEGLHSKLIKRSIYEKVKFPNNHLTHCEDGVQSIQIVYHSNKAVPVPNVSYSYRVDSTVSATKTTNLTTEERGKVSHATAVVVMVKILQDFFGDSFLFNRKFDFYFRKAVAYYHQFSRETKIKYGIEGIISSDFEEDALISILIAVYNTDKYLPKCLDSVLNQTYKNIEVICVNDCSTDSSLAILNEYAQKDSRIIVVDKAVNEGSAQAKKAAFAASKGEYILYVDSDDWIEPNMVELLYYASVGCDMVYCDFYKGTPSGEYTEKAPHILPNPDKLLRIKQSSFGFRNIMWNKLVKRKIYEKVKFGEESIGEDTYITAQLYYYADKINYVNKPLYHWLYNDKSLSNNNTSRTYKEMKANYEHVIDFCKEKFGEDLSVFEPELSNRKAYIEKQNSNDKPPA